MTAAPDPRCRVPWDFDRVAMDEAVWNWAGERLAAARESRLALRQSAHIKARQAIEGTEGGADTRQRGSRETMRAGVRMTVILGADPFEEMKDALSPRAWNAGCKLRDLWSDCLPGMEMPGTYGNGAGHGGQRHLSAEEEDAAGRAWREYAEAMDRLRAETSATHVVAVRRCVLECQAMPDHLVSAGLEALGRYWRLK